MTTLEEAIKIIKSLIKIGKIFIETRDFNKTFNEVLKMDTFTAYIFGILVAETNKEINSQYTQNIYLNYIKVLQMLKEGKSEKEIIDDFIRAWKQWKLEEYTMYGG